MYGITPNTAHKDEQRQRNRRKKSLSKKRALGKKSQNMEEERERQHIGSRGKGCKRQCHPVNPCLYWHIYEYYQYYYHYYYCSNIEHMAEDRYSFLCVCVCVRGGHTVRLSCVPPDRADGLSAQMPVLCVSRRNETKQKRTWKFIILYHQL